MLVNKRHRWVVCQLAGMVVWMMASVHAANTLPSLPDHQKSTMQNPFSSASSKLQKNGAYANKKIVSPTRGKSNVDNLISQMAKQRASTAASKGVRQEDGLALRDQAFWTMKQDLFPLDPHQIHDLRDEFNEQQRAKTSYQGRIPPKPTSSSIVVDLSPGATSPVIRLAAGFVTSLVFVDSTGAPWPIRAYDIGDPKAFNIQWETEASDKSKKGLDPAATMSNVMLIQAMSMYKEGNMAVMLLGMNTPIMLTLIPGQREVDYRVDLRLPRHGPLAQPTLNENESIAGVTQQYEGDLLKVLNRIAPADSKTLPIDGGPAEAWLKDDLLYIRTSMTVISPSWLSKMSSSDGMTHVYVMPATSVLLALDHGKTFHLSVKGV